MVIIHFACLIGSCDIFKKMLSPLPHGDVALTALSWAGVQFNSLLSTIFLMA